MAETMSELAACVEQIARFTGKNLATKIGELEFKFAGLQRAAIGERLKTDSLNLDLVVAAQRVKRAAAQIDVVLHAIGILVSLPLILDEGEKVESLSLGAGSSESKRFDLETDRRIAEFTFIEWQGNDSARLHKIFKDFFRISEFKTEKRKELWLTEDSQVLKYLQSGQSVRSAIPKSWEVFRSKYPNVATVSEYYRLHSRFVAVRVLPRIAEGIAPG